MRVVVEIAYRHVERSGWLEQRVMERAATLGQQADVPLTGCRVELEAPDAAGQAHYVALILQVGGVAEVVEVAASGGETLRVLAGLVDDAFERAAVRLVALGPELRRAAAGLR